MFTFLSYAYISVFLHGHLNGFGVRTHTEVTCTRIFWVKMKQLQSTWISKILREALKSYSLFYGKF